VLHRPVRSSTHVRVVEGRPVWTSTHGRIEGQLGSVSNVMTGGRCSGTAAQRRAPGAVVAVAAIVIGATEEVGAQS
jgi:hypothetical protein